jgi:hypothetical protein
VADDKAGAQGRKGFIAWWRARQQRRAGVSRGLQFDVGLQSASDPIPAGGDLWYQEQNPRAAEPIDVTLIPSGGERTAELIHDETTYFSDDLADPRNPRHAEWEARREAAIEDGEKQVEAAAVAEEHENPPS